MKSTVQSVPEISTAICPADAGGGKKNVTLSEGTRCANKHNSAVLKHGRTANRCKTHQSLPVSFQVPQLVIFSSISFFKSISIGMASKTKSCWHVSVGVYPGNFLGQLDTLTPPLLGWVCSYGEKVANKIFCSLFACTFPSDSCSVGSQVYIYSTSTGNTSLLAFSCGIRHPFTHRMISSKQMQVVRNFCFLAVFNSCRNLTLQCIQRAEIFNVS